ncbi:MAG: hypothetical protein GWN71_34910, partial [Gammaproteobacteria bacterium]|nr:metallophosphoesterase family protein [Gemmatimonadota bacterium]NIT68334.1 metallophosphoesterase family protein [Gemmatimonadota bacterium]NIU78561.1 hypothetical protein [Gammaproteobacteria bacterium]NIW76886.1 hypothetical protein [Gemmatimonadota bacterium]NIY36911.1 hypothetical protein [Gemmatimonadota bacterium]
VLADLPSVDAIICCGDLVGYYPEPDLVVDRIRELGVPCVRGNHELMVVGAVEADPEQRPRYRIDWTRERLGPDRIRWLRALPRSMELSWDGLAIQVRHASPWDETTYLYPDSPRLEEIRLAEHEWLVVGHTHYPLHRRCGSGFLVNPGSVGQPRDWDPRAAYGLLDTRTGRWRQRRVPYDHAAYQRRLAAMDWHPQTIALLGRTRGAAEPRKNPSTPTVK